MKFVATRRSFRRARARERRDERARARAEFARARRFAMGRATGAVVCGTTMNDDSRAQLFLTVSGGPAPRAADGNGTDWIDWTRRVTRAADGGD